MDLPHEVEIGRWIAAMGRISAPHRDLDRVLGAIERLQDRPCRLHCLLDGEPGTGKEGLGRVLHRLMHAGAAAPLVRLATTGRPAADIEADLAARERPDGELGALARARGGSLLIEELLDLPPGAQRRLLDALRGPRPDVTVIALTDGDARDAVRGGRLRHDLYYRLARLWLTLPPLRDRPEDLQQAALWMVNRVLRARGSPLTATIAEAATPDGGAGGQGGFAVQPGALAALRDHDWSGNFRELEAVLERAVLLHSDGACLTPADVRGALRKAPL